MKDNRKLIFLAHPRSGSSSLYQILQLHPELNILEEPFNEGFAAWSPDGKTYLDRLVDLPAFEEVLAEIFASYNGLKLLNYQLDDYLNTYLFEREDFLFIFLRRRNILQSVVSCMVADQTGLWKKWEMKKSFEEYYRHLEPLDISAIQKDVGEIAWQLEDQEAQLDRRPAGTVLKFIYEDLFFCRLAEQRRQIETIWSFLGLSPLENDLVDYYLSPRQVKINTEETYRLIPNAAEIDATCGNDRTGWLFKN